jgi:indolepyruvate decarboxylase
MLLADTGDAIFGAGEMFLPQGLEFIGQAFYMSIGFALPGTLGAMLAAPERRAVTFIGDGAFQMTGQELSTIIRHRLNPIIFLLNNEGYTIERVLRDGPYNDVQMWKYHRLPEVFGGGWGCEVRTEDDLEAALRMAQDRPNDLAFIEVRLDRWDYTDGLRKLGKVFNRK